jgi:hypothetical protein
MLNTEPSPTNEDNKSENGENKINEENSRAKMRWILNTFFINKGSVWTAIFTGALVFFTYKLSNVSDKQNEIAVASQRGFLTFLGPQMGVRMVDNNGNWTAQEVAAVWINAGNTATREVVIQNNAAAFFPDIPSQYNFPLSDPKFHVVIGPKANYGTNIQLPKDVIADNIQAKKRIFLWGTAVYKDTFSTPDRLTEFCVELTHLTFNQPPGLKSPSQISLNDPTVMWQGFEWNQCPQHNCYDRDCPDYDTMIQQQRQK